MAPLFLLFQWGNPQRAMPDSFVWFQGCSKKGCKSKYFLLNAPCSVVYRTFLQCFVVFSITFAVSMSAAWRSATRGERSMAERKE